MRKSEREKRGKEKFVENFKTKYFDPSSNGKVKSPINNKPGEI